MNIIIVVVTHRSDRWEERHSVDQKLISVALVRMPGNH